MSTDISYSALLNDAPFSANQRAWLHGFFAGVFKTNATTIQNTDTKPTTETDENTDNFPWHDPALPIEERIALSEGHPKAHRLMSAMAQLDCGSCGYDCFTYARAIERGEENDLTKCAPGGNETAAKLKELVKLTTTAAPKPKSKTPKIKSSPEKPLAAAEAHTKYNRDNPYYASLLTNTPLNKPGSAKDTRHVVINLAGSDLNYSPGDALGVYPNNRMENIDRIIELLHATGGEDVPKPPPDNKPISLRYALSKYYNINSPTPSLIELLSKATSPDDGKKIKELIKHHPDTHILDVLEKCQPSKLKPAEFISTLTPMRPRLYSIASSPKAHANEVHLTVGVVRYTNHSGCYCHGVASTFLADNVRPGERLRVFVHQAKHFRLPKDPGTPIIMVGPGTGIAPFRAFIHERHKTGASGNNWLFFGDQHENTDFLYRQELETFHRQDVLHRLDTVFSRDGNKKHYVQHRMKEHGKELWSWLKNGAHFYICGDAKRMAADVENALGDIITEHGSLNKDETKKYIADMIKNKRYQRDVY